LKVETKARAAENFQKLMERENCRRKGYEHKISKKHDKATATLSSINCRLSLRIAAHVTTIQTGVWYCRRGSYAIRVAAAELTPRRSRWCRW